ncbi:MAG: DUF58 domain-containing protein [Pseudomonadota bacterium]
METRELIKKIRRLEIATRRAVHTQLAGGYHSVFKGRGMVVSDVRPYQTGDDWRAVDWNVTARTGDLHVKEFMEERELVVVLVVDLSASLRFATRQAAKRELAAQLAALIGFTAIRNRDKVGLCLFTDHVEAYLPPKKGRQHGLHVIREILGRQPEGEGTRLDLALEFVARVVRHGSVVFVVSDFLFGDDGLLPAVEVQARVERALRIAAVRHDLVALQVNDPFEQALPEVGLLRVRDLESGRDALVDTSNVQVRARYAQLQAARQATLDSQLARLAIDHLHIRSDEDPVPPLVSFFAARRHRGGRA